jgi:hypothetical protein
VLYWELMVLLGAMTVSTMISIYAHLRISQITTGQLVDRILDLDQALGEAISRVLEGGIGDFEPPNPIVSMLTQYFATQLNPNIVEATVMQGEDGKFIKKME